MSKQNGVYVFGAIRDQEINLGTIDFEGQTRPIYKILYHDAAMIAIDVPMKIYHPTKQNLFMHQEVISRVMQQTDAVIPISFGNIFNTEDDVKKLTESIYPQFETIFNKIEGKIELGLKVIAKKEWLDQEISKHPEIHRQKEVVNGKSEAAGYFDRIKLGEMATKFMKKLQSDIEREVHEALKPFAEAAVTNEPIGEKMLLNSAYLIEREKEDEFDAKVNDLHDKWKDHVDFKYTGPWPAYNFINIKLKVEKSS